MPYSPTLTWHCTITRSLQSFEIYKHFCAPQMGTRHVSFMPRHRAREPPTWWWSPPWSSTIMRPLTRIRPSAHSPLASRVLRLNWNKAPRRWPSPPTQDAKVYCRCYCEAKVHRDPCARVTSALKARWPSVRIPNSCCHDFWEFSGAPSSEQWSMSS
jgi:hypothetical protein